MGQFSWMYCDTQNKENLCEGESAFVVIPEDFGGGYIYEPFYNGYGVFGGCDIYDLVAIWNRKYIVDNPEKYRDKSWFPYWSDLSLTPEQAIDSWDLNSTYKNEMRDIGIAIACYDEDNASIKYSIKICKNEPKKDYDSYLPSFADGNQGWYKADPNDYSDEFASQIYDIYEASHPKSHKFKIDRDER